MRKLANISQFESLQSRANLNCVADVSVFNGKYTAAVIKTVKDFPLHQKNIQTLCDLVGSEVFIALYGDKANRFAFEDYAMEEINKECVDAINEVRRQGLYDTSDKEAERYLQWNGVTRAVRHAQEMSAKHPGWWKKPAVVDDGDDSEADPWFLQ